MFLNVSHGSEGFGTEPGGWFSEPSRVLIHDVYVLFFMDDRRNT